MILIAGVTTPGYQRQQRANGLRCRLSATVRDEQDHWLLLMGTLDHYAAWVGPLLATASQQVHTKGDTLIFRSDLE
jgi:hypothetical protein